MCSKIGKTYFLIGFSDQQDILLKEGRKRESIMDDDIFCRINLQERRLLCRTI